MEASDAARSPLAGRWPCSALHGQLPPVAWAFGAGRARRAARLRPDGGRRAARGCRDVVVRAARARAARRALDGRPRLRRRGRGDHDCRRAPPRPAHEGWDAAVVGPGPGILGSATALGHGGLVGARLRARRAGARAADVGGRADDRERPAAAPPRPLAPHAHACSTCCSRAGRRCALPEGGSSASAARSRHDWRRRGRPDGYQCLRTAPHHGPRRPALLRGRARRRDRARCHDPRAMSDRDFEQLGRDRLGGEDRHVASSASASPTARRSSREVVAPSRRGRRRGRSTTSTSGSCASRARRSATRTARDPGRQARRRGRVAVETKQRELAEEIGKEADDWRAPDVVLHERRLDGRAGPRLPGHRPARRADAEPPTRTSASRSSPGRWTRLDEAIARSKRLQDAHRPAAAQGAPGEPLSGGGQSAARSS